MIRTQSRSDGSARLADVDHRPAAEPVLCRRCGKQFDYLVKETIRGIVQLRVGSLLIMELHSNCLECGCPFYWNVRAKDMERMTVVYSEVLAAIRRYMPE